ncbi:Pyruvate carboxyltransferase [Senna tora]|uniref:Pyruvate carboxyltransferase n=1 Tax=Senna tora TaxID=362788 RepID=A0A834TVL1_9FABA|nr:Pyruvate carboxyltransferase [Senna tora]
MEMDEPLPPIPSPTPFSARALMIDIDIQIVAQNRDFWEHYLIGFLIDKRKIRLLRLQYIINTSWHLIERVKVVGRVGRRYVIYFEHLDDLYFMYLGGPWSVHSSLLSFIPWEYNMVVSRLTITEVPIWIQLSGLPLEYQIPRIARKFYERLYKFYKNCARMGHVHEDCRWTREEAMTVIDNHIQWIRQEFGLELGISLTRAQFINNFRTFINQNDRRLMEVTVIDTPNGYNYRPWTQLPIDFEWDPNGVLDANRNMVPPAGDPNGSQEDSLPNENAEVEVLTSNDGFPPYNPNNFIDDLGPTNSDQVVPNID